MQYDNLVIASPIKSNVKPIDPKKIVSPRSDVREFIPRTAGSFQGKSFYLSSAYDWIVGK